MSYDSRLNIESVNMNQKFQPILSTTQQNKLLQLQLEIETLEKQVDYILKSQLATRGNSPIYLSNRFAKTGIRLADVEG